MRMRDACGLLDPDADVADRFAVRGQPAAAPWRLALVTVLPSAEGLGRSPGRGRLDWPSALSRSLADAGFDASVLSEFRARVMAGSAELRRWDRMLVRLAERGWLAGARPAAHRFDACAGQDVGARVACSAVPKR